MTRTVKASEVKTRFYEFLKGVQKRDDEIVVTKDGEPAAVLLNYQEYESLIETLEVLSDPEAMKRIQEVEAYRKKGGKFLSHEEVFGLPLPPARR